jgi:membrane protease YdiL (CAAX protease family)
MSIENNQIDQSPKNSLSQPRLLRDLIIVGSPIIIMGVIGNLIGIESIIGGIIINLGYVLMIIIGSILLKYQSNSWTKIGLNYPSNWLRTILLGIGSFLGAIFLFVAVQAIFFAIFNAVGLAPSEVDQSRFNPIQGNFPLLLLMIILAWTTIAFGEELFFRSFLISRMQDIASLKRWFAILIAGIIFGLAHFAECPIGILANASFGIFFGWVFVKSSRNLWITIIGHGILNTMRFIILFYGLN